MRLWFKSMLFWSAVLGISSHAEALPQFALLTSNRCVNCHTTVQGGGQRDELGQYSMDGVGLVAPDYYLPGRTAFADGRVLVGGDFRLQMARSHKSPDAARRVFPMQAAIYGKARMSQVVKAEGSYNFGPKKYDGQRAWTASALVQPNFKWPQVRVGHFQPQIGMRYDDHTMLVRQLPDAVGTRSLIAPNYAEYGAEIHYYRPLWLSVTGGIFTARALSENRVFHTGESVSLIQDRDHPSLLGRVELWPKLPAQKLNFYAGGSVLKNKDFRLVNLFGGAGWMDRAAIMLEVAHHEKGDLQDGRTATVDVSVQPRAGLLLYARGEHGKVTIPSTGGGDVVTTSRQAVLGAQVFLTPQMELRPEYRILDAETFRSSRWAVQIHVFY